MKRVTRFSISFLALLVGVFIVGVSLTAVSPVLSSDDSLEASSRELYWSQTVLPDNVIYPVIMLTDRAKLELASPEDRVTIQLEYSTRRLESARELLADGKNDLALETLIKSQYYLIYAGQEVLQEDLSTYLKERVIKTLAERSIELSGLLLEFPDYNRPVLDRVLLESQNLVGQLQSAS